jgi:translation initiation factor 4B
MDLDTQRPKGFGYVEFMDRESLLSALAMNGESLQKRSVRINVAEGRKLKLILEKSRAPRHDDPKFASDWRRPPGNADRSFRDQFSSRGNSDRVGSFTRRDHDQKSGWGSGGAFQKRELNSILSPKLRLYTPFRG